MKTSIAIVKNITEGTPGSPSPTSQDTEMLDNQHNNMNLKILQK